MNGPARTTQGRPVRSPHPGKTADRTARSTKKPAHGSFKPGWHTVPWLLTTRLREAGFSVLERADGHTVQASPGQRDNLIRLRTTADADVQAQVVMNSPVGMALGYQQAAPKVARQLDKALGRCEETRDIQVMLAALKQARGELGAARKQFAPPPPERPHTGIQIVHGGLPSLGKHR